MASEAPTSPTRDPANAAPFWRRWPMVRVGLLVVSLLVIGEQFPFSYFPMYSSFDPETDYYYVTDEAGQPLACVPVFGTSTANVKKMYRTRLRALVATRGASEAEATDEERRRVGEEMIVYLRQLGASHGIAAPAGTVRLVRVVVTRSADRIRKEERFIAQQ